MVVVALLLVIGLAGTVPFSVQAKPAGYSFTVQAFLGDSAPGPEGGSFTFDFEPWSINDRGEGAFAADLTTEGEGVFLVDKEQISKIIRAGETAPGGGTFGGFGVFSHTAINDDGDIAFAFGLEPFTLPSGLNAGVYHFSHINKTVTAVMVPGITPAPGGGVFEGVAIHAWINNKGDIVFAGTVTGADIDPSTPPGFNGLGTGIFRADKKGQISSVVRPGDPAPGGNTFDFAENPWINDGGDITFGAHVTGEECIDFGVPQSERIFCAESVYFMKAATGRIQSIAHQGDPAPGGGTYRLAFGPVINNQGQIAFIGDLTPAPGFGVDLGVFLFSKGSTIPVARPGDSMPGGGHIVRASFNILNYHLNNHGEVAFSAILDTDDNNDSVADTGLYVFSGGSLRLVARTGTVIPGVGTIAHLSAPDLVGSPNPGLFPDSGAANNDRGEVFFQATLTDGRGVLLIATPRP